MLFVSVFQRAYKFYYDFGRYLFKFSIVEKKSLKFEIDEMIVYFVWRYLKEKVYE